LRELVDAERLLDPSDARDDLLETVLAEERSFSSNPSPGEAQLVAGDDLAERRKQPSGHMRMNRAARPRFFVAPAVERA
jgi:hypothetical protein